MFCQPDLDLWILTRSGVAVHVWCHHITHSKDSGSHLSITCWAKKKTSWNFHKSHGLMDDFCGSRSRSNGNKLKSDMMIIWLSVWFMESWRLKKNTYHIWYHIYYMYICKDIYIYLHKYMQYKHLNSINLTTTHTKNSKVPVRSGVCGLRNLCIRQTGAPRVVLRNEGNERGPKMACDTLPETNSWPQKIGGWETTQNIHVAFLVSVASKGPPVSLVE